LIFNDGSGNVEDDKANVLHEEILMCRQCVATARQIVRSG
jgi:hypothetical protein